MEQKRRKAAVQAGMEATRQKVKEVANKSKQPARQRSCCTEQPLFRTSTHQEIDEEAKTESSQTDNPCDVVIVSRQEVHAKSEAYAAGNIRVWSWVNLVVSA